MSEEMFLSMIAKAKEDLKTRQQQMALQEEEKKKRLVRVESTPATPDVPCTFIIWYLTRMFLLLETCYIPATFRAIAICWSSISRYFMLLKM